MQEENEWGNEIRIGAKLLVLKNTVIMGAVKQVILQHSGFANFTFIKICNCGSSDLVGPKRPQRRRLLFSKNVSKAQFYTNNQPRKKGSREDLTYYHPIVFLLNYTSSDHDKSKKKLFTGNFTAN